MLATGIAIGVLTLAALIASGIGTPTSTSPQVIRCTQAWC